MGTSPTLRAWRGMPEGRSAMRADADLFRAVFEAAPDGIIVVDEEGCITEANAQALRMFGYAERELLGQRVELLVPESAREVHARHRLRYMEAPATRPMGIGMELAGRRKDGTEFPVEISLSPLRRATGLSVIAMVRDVSLRKRLREFGVGALRAAEEERHRIARELHDDMAQQLSSLLVLLRLVRLATDREARDQRLEEMHEQLLSVAEETRRIARGLRPPVLSDAGVVPALRALLRDLRQSARLEVELDAEPVDVLLSEDAKLVVYRIVQEALSNVVRHAEAERVSVRLTQRDGRVVVEVRDDGRGFEAEAPGGHAGLGLIGMQERASTVGGSLWIHSRPGEGTRVNLEIVVGAEAVVDG